MSRGVYLTPLDVRAYGKERWVLLDWFGYRTFIRGEPIDIWVPPGYISDMASIPQIFRSLLPQVGPYRYAAIPHDWLFDTQDQHDFSFGEVNDIMNEAMRTRAPQFYIPRTPGYQRVPIKFAIDVGSGIPWSNNTSHKFRDDGLLNPEPGGPRGDFGAKSHERSGHTEVPPGESRGPDPKGITTPRVP